MSHPTVSFVVPCYKLAHYLPECVNSILAQTFADFEVLIMDDCSPDNTPEVASAIKDPRVRHIRNEPNLGHIRNYNKGIGLAQGRYVWIISADDALARPYVLEKFVGLLEAHPGAGYVFCPVLSLVEGHPPEPMPHYKRCGATDALFRRPQWLMTMAEANYVPAPAALARRTCYETHGLFPPDLPHACDWFLWALFALHHDVGYFAEPMVYYRQHAANMTKSFEGLRLGAQQDMLVRWRLRSAALAAGLEAVAWDVETALVRAYVDQFVNSFENGAQAGLTEEDLDADLARELAVEAERAHFRARVRTVRAARYEPQGDRHYLQGNLGLARRYYETAMTQGFRPWRSRLKLALLRSGSVGAVLRRMVSLRHR